MVRWESQTPPPRCDRCECTTQICIRMQTRIPRFGEGCLQTVLVLTCWESSRRGLPPCSRSRLLLGTASVLGRATRRLPLTQPPPPALDTSQGHPTLAPLGAGCVPPPPPPTCRPPPTHLRHALLSPLQTSQPATSSIRATQTPRPGPCLSTHGLLTTHVRLAKSPSGNSDAWATVACESDSPTICP